MTAEELLQNIYKQMARVKTKKFNPKFTIWIHSDDMETILAAPRLGNILPIVNTRRARYPTKLWGQTLIVSDDTPVGKPLVEAKVK
jgi:hypothetical protein